MKVMIVTGASSGIGGELVRQISAHEGERVGLILAARRQEALEAVAKDVRANGAQVLVVPTDVTDRAACRHLITTTIAHFGRIDVLINNAGQSAHANFAQTSEQDLDWYERLMVINHWSVVWLTHAALPHLLQSKGLVVGVSSLAGLVGVPGRTAYCATKFAMTGFLEALRAELGHKGLRVMQAFPGTVDTNTRKTGFAQGGGAAGVSMLKDDKPMAVETCARLIRLGMQRGKREVVMTPKAKFGRWLRLLAPGIVDRMAMREIKDSYRP